LATVTRRIGLSLGADLCWPLCYEELVRRADDDPAWFHERLVDFVGYRFYRQYREIVDRSRGAPWARWCVGGTTNVGLNWFFNKHKAKVQLTYRMGENVDGVDGADTDTTYLQTQFVF